MRRRKSWRCAPGLPGPTGRTGGWPSAAGPEPISMATMERIVTDADLTSDILFQFIYLHLPLDDRARHEELSGIDGFLARHEAAVCDTTRQLIDRKSAEFERGF